MTQPKPLSPAAQAVLSAFLGATPTPGVRELAAALRAAADQAFPEPQKTDKDQIVIDSLRLSTRAEHVLKRAGILTVGDLKGFTYSDLLLLKGIGVMGADEVENALASIDVSLFDSRQARSLGWSDVAARRKIRHKILAIATELEAHQ